MRRAHASHDQPIRAGAPPFGVPVQPILESLLEDLPGTKRPYFAGCATDKEPAESDVPTEWIVTPDIGSKIDSVRVRSLFNMNDLAVRRIRRPDVLSSQRIHFVVS